MRVVENGRATIMRMRAAFYRRVIESVRYYDDGATDDEVVVSLRRAADYLEASIRARNAGGMK